ncbi:YoaK family protein [Chryseobacterium sp. NFX27]|uniref:YoaK family protein n=1 Tax=Chryseobacterium sp. NFX27 TaxID=2819618 RepID=UPI003CF90029
MFRHRGKRRTYSHNLKLASALSFVAGIVNITGVLSVKVLTTNITGHFAFFSEEILFKKHQSAFMYLLFILFFLMGSFISSLIIEFYRNGKKIRPHTFPIIIEIILLSFVGLSGDLPRAFSLSSHIIAYILLFSMGIQNSLVTRVSQSVVRTTHLTGLFTDLGIDLSQIVFNKEYTAHQQLKKSIFLKLVIIICFFSGCIVGGLLYKLFYIKTLLFASGFLVYIIWYDRILYRYYFLRRKLR